MVSTSTLKSLALGTAIVVLGGTAATGVFYAGERIGRYRAAKTVSDVVRGERELEELEQSDLLPEESEEKGYTARGFVVSSGSGEMTIETKGGNLRTVILTGQTSVRSGGMKVIPSTLRVGDVIFVLGLPSERKQNTPPAQDEGTRALEASPQSFGNDVASPEGVVTQAQSREQAAAQQAPKQEIRARLIRVVKRGT